MGDISVLGLGLMGTALARAIQAAGHRLCVWNRSPEKMRPLVATGAEAAETVAAAVAASPVVLVCIDSYATTHEILGTEDVTPRLAGKTVIQLGTGTPREARESEAWMTAHGAAYLDGAVMGGPTDIATPEGLVLLAGAEATHTRCRALLDCLVGDLRYLGDNIAAAASLDLAWLSQRYGLFLGVVHGARLCEAEGVGVDIYATMFPRAEQANSLARKIHENAFENPTATLGVWREALRRIQIHAQDAGITSEIPDFCAGFLDRAIAAGHGEEDIAALVKVLR